MHKSRFDVQQWRLRNAERNAVWCHKSWYRLDSNQAYDISPVPFNIQFEEAEHVERELILVNRDGPRIGFLTQDAIRESCQLGGTIRCMDCKFECLPQFTHFQFPCCKGYVHAPCAGEICRNSRSSGRRTKAYKSCPGCGLYLTSDERSYYYWEWIFQEKREVKFQVEDRKRARQLKQLQNAKQKREIMLQAADRKLTGELNQIQNAKKQTGKRKSDQRPPKGKKLRKKPAGKRKSDAKAPKGKKQKTKHERTSLDELIAAQQLMMSGRRFTPARLGIK